MVKIQDFTTSNGAQLIAVYTHFDDQFIRFARKAGGKWNSEGRCWIFDYREKQKVKDKLKLCNKTIAFVKGRDNGAYLGDGVILLEGDLDSGGSRNNPALIIKDNAVLLIRNFPKVLVEKALSIPQLGIDDDDNLFKSIEVVDE